MPPKPCGLFVGFLVPHPCPNLAVCACSKCGRNTCEEHAGVVDAGLLCRACESGSELPVALAGAVAAGLLAAPLFMPSDIAAFDAAALDDEDAPEDQFADLS
jgi:hypothetical protein